MEDRVVRLRDNRFGDSALAFKRNGDGFVSQDPCSEGLGGQQISKDARTILKKFGQLSLGDLVDRSKGSLVDLSGTHLDDNGRGNLCFFDFKGPDDDASPFYLETGNLMGVLCFREKESGKSIQVEILSRFDKENDNHNFFLNYLLSKAFNCALGAEEVSAERSSLLDVLLDIVFVRRLGEAILDSSKAIPTLPTPCASCGWASRRRTICAPFFRTATAASRFATLSSAKSGSPCAVLPG